MSIQQIKPWLLGALLVLGACNAPSDPTPPPPADHAVASRTPAVSANEPATTPATAGAADTAPARPMSCSSEIGAAAAARRVAVCQTVSPATHPPCNAANSCAMIEEEIARGCTLFDGEGTAMKGCETDPKGAQAAADVIRRYYAAINARDYGAAWMQWGENGRPGQTFAAFVDGFAHTRSTRVVIGKLEPAEGAAGSIYQSIPVTVEATLDNGTRQRFSGAYVVRRVNGVDGASPAQLRWHIASARLRAQTGSP